jgi:signal transduction histidine kinase
VRLLSELLGEVIAVRLQLQEEFDLRKADEHSAHAYDTMVRLLSSSGAGWAERIALPSSHPRLTDLVASGGAACLDAGTVHVIGDAPPASVIRALPATLEPKLVDEMFHAASVDEVPALAAYAGAASGVLAVRLAADNAAWMFWFRPEKVRSVTWAGKPEKDVSVEQGVARLSPRQSFAAWTDEQRGRAEPWTLTDVAGARRVREAVVDLLLRLQVVTAAAAEIGLLRVRRACEASTLPLAVLDTRGHPVFINAAWTTLLGPVDPEVEASLQVGAHFAGPIVREQLRQVLTGHASSYASETELARTPTVPVLITIDAVCTDRGLPAGAVVVVTDLRDRVRREDERLLTQARIDQADRTAALGLVTGAVAHDFNNLLTAILCETALLADDVVEEGPQRDGLERIERTARRAADLCRQLLAYAGKGTFVVRRTDLVVLAHDVLAALRSILPPGVVVSIRTISPMLHVVVDADQVRQVLMNLILNAAEASVDGRTEVEVSLETAQLAAPRAFGSATEPAPSGEYAIMRVIDYGVGIPEASRPRIFEPFFTTKRTGKGLGLATVLGIVRSHRGVVEVESREGAGSRFSVWLPAAPAVQRDSSRPPAPTVTRILVVEDEPAARVVVRRILEREGYVVLTAADVASARAILANAAVDLALVFTDLGLPDGSGRDVLAAAAARDRGLPVILTSGMNHALEPLSEGTPNLVAFLPKPFGRSDLLEAVARGIDRGGG